MSRLKLMTAIAALATLVLAVPVQAQRHGGGGSAGQGRAAPRLGGGVGPAVPRGGVALRPPVFGPYRSYRYYPYYYYPYRGFGLGFYYGYPGYYGYPWYGYGGYGYGGYRYGYPGYITAAPSQAYGRVRIQDAPPDAQVFADGYYTGVVDDFDGAFQHLNLEPGVHRIEIRTPGFETLVFDVNVQPGQTITYRAQMRLLQP